MLARGFAKDLVQNHPSLQASGWRAAAVSTGLTDALASLRANLLANHIAIREAKLFPYEDETL